MVVEFMELDKKNLRTPVPLWMQKEKLPAWAAAEKKRVLAGEVAPEARESDIKPVAIVKRK